MKTGAADRLVEAVDNLTDIADVRQIMDLVASTS